MQNINVIGHFTICFHLLYKYKAFSFLGKYLYSCHLMAKKNTKFDVMNYLNYKLLKRQNYKNIPNQFSLQFMNTT